MLEAQENAVINDASTLIIAPEGPLPTDTSEPSPKEPTHFQVTCFGSSELSGNEHAITTVIQVEDFDEKEEKEDDSKVTSSELESSKEDEEEGGGLAPPLAELDRSRMLGGSVPLPIPASHHHQLAHERARQRGVSAEPHVSYANLEDEIPKAMRKTISGKKPGLRDDRVSVWYTAAIQKQFPR